MVQSWNVKPPGFDPERRLPLAEPAVKRPATAPRAFLDPYYRWAKATRWRSFARNVRALGSLDPRGTELRLIVGVPSSLDEKKLKILLESGPWVVAAIYKKPIRAGRKLARHFTASIPSTPEALTWLEAQSFDWELAVPNRDATTMSVASRWGKYGEERERSDFKRDIPVLKAAEVEERSDAPRLPLSSAIAVIDFGCPFLNWRFDAARGPGTRVVALWDQGALRDASRQDEPWQAAPDGLHGRALTQPALDGLLAAARDPDGPVDEFEAYRQLDYLIAYDDPRRRVWRSSHGAHVLDMAGGRRDPLGDPHEDGTDAAGDAPLIFVQLPALTAADSSGASLTAQLLDGVRYALQCCRDDAKLVVNISYGRHTGPHDAGSLIETALDEILKLRKTNLAIVLGAGNARLSGCHTRRTVRPNRSALLRVDVVPGDTTETFVEIWYERPAASITLEARVRTGEGDWCGWLKAGDEALLYEPGVDLPVAMLRHDEYERRRFAEEADKPTDKNLVLLALAPTMQPADDDGPLTRPGRWEIELKVSGTSDDESSVEVYAVIGRDDPGDLSDGIQSTFADLDRSDLDETLNGIATGRHTIAVGAIYRDTGRETSYSSRGTKPDIPVVYAAAECSEQDPGIRAAAVSSLDSYRMNGTSVAAPVLARRIYNWMMANPGVSSTNRSEVLGRVIAAEKARARAAGEAPCLRTAQETRAADLD